MIALIFHIWVVVLDSCSQYAPSHAIFNLFTYIHMSGANEGLQSLSFSCMCGHYLGCSQCPTSKCPRPTKANPKPTTPKGAFTI